jgi:cell division protein ZapA (FtsZ GTPase activity inhibitor)
LERILEIELFGEQFRFKADAEDKHAEKAIDYLVGKVDSLSGHAPLSKNEANRFVQLLLAALNICNEYIDLKDRHEALMQAVQARSSNIVSKIERTIK